MSAFSWFDGVFRVCLVGERKFEVPHQMTRCRKAFSDTNKKINFITRLETARQIY